MEERGGAVGQSVIDVLEDVELGVEAGALAKQLGQGGDLAAANLVAGEAG